MKRFIYWLLTMLGFSTIVGCQSNEEEEWNQVCAYGSPYISYKAKGRIVDSSNKPIKNIQVVQSYVWSIPLDSLDYRFFATDTSYTNSNGEYLLQTTYLGDAQLGAIINDIDGTLNKGEFAQQKVVFDFSQVQLDETAKDVWYKGAKTINQDIVLEEKTDDEE